MKRTLSETAAAVAGGAITYVIFAYVADAPMVVRVAVAAVVVLTCLVGASLARRRSRTSETSRLVVADRLKAEGDISVTDIDLEKRASDTAVGTRLRSGGNTEVRGIRIGDADGTD